jgi:hypothetical protein
MRFVSQLVYRWLSFTYRSEGPGVKDDDGFDDSSFGVLDDHGYCMDLNDRTC